MLKKLQICFLGYLCPPKSKFKSNWLVDILCSIKTLFPRHWRDIFIPKFRDYLTEGLSPLIGGLFHRRSRSISSHLKNYLSDKGAVFRQPQADISQERSDFISQAEGLCISNKIKNQWFLQTCLVLLILLGNINEVSSQVAYSPPGIELVDNPGIPALAGFHRSGETRSDTFSSGSGHEIDGGPGLKASIQSQSISNEFHHQPAMLDKYSKVNESAVDCGLRTVDCNLRTVDCGQMTVDCFDASDFQMQEEALPSAPSGALIYGELINPDSLGPLRFQVSENRFLPRVQSSVHDFPIELEQGQFLDGVLSHKIKKFRVKLPEGQPAYLSIQLADRVLMEDFILFPSDSVMLYLDLESMQLVFGGPSADWLNAQYLIKRGEESDTFYSRILFDNDRDTYLNKNDNRATWNQYKTEFAPQLKILNIGKDGADYVISELMVDDYWQIPGYRELQQTKSYLTEERYELLKSELLGNYFSEKLKKFRQYQYGIPQIKGQEHLLDEMDQKLPVLSEKIRTDIEGLKPNLISMGYNSMLSEWVKLERIISGNSFEEIAKSNFHGEVLDKLLTGNLLDRIPYDPVDWQSWKEYTEGIQSDPWREIANQELELYRTGQPVAPVIWQDLEGKEWSPSNFHGKPTLFYFYFSTCTHSANYFKNYLWPLYQELAGELGFRLVAVSTDNDPNLWKANLETYSNRELLNLNFSMDQNQDWLQRYHIQGYPSTLLMDAEGRLISFSLKGENYRDYRDRFIQLLSKW